MINQRRGLARDTIQIRRRKVRRKLTQLCLKALTDPFVRVRTAKPHAFTRPQKVAKKKLLAITLTITRTRVYAFFHLPLFPSNLASNIFTVSHSLARGCRVAATYLRTYIRKHNSQFRVSPKATAVALYSPSLFSRVFRAVACARKNYSRSLSRPFAADLEPPKRDLKAAALFASVAWPARYLSLALATHTYCLYSGATMAASLRCLHGRESARARKLMDECRCRNPT